MLTEAQWTKARELVAIRATNRSRGELAVATGAWATQRKPKLKGRITRRYRQAVAQFTRASSLQSRLWKLRAKHKFDATRRKFLVIPNFLESTMHNQT